MDTLPVPTADFNVAALHTALRRTKLILHRFHRTTLWGKYQLATLLSLLGWVSIFMYNIQMYVVLMGSSGWDLDPLEVQVCFYVFLFSLLYIHCHSSVSFIKYYQGRTGWLEILIPADLQVKPFHHMLKAFSVVLPVVIGNSHKSERKPIREIFYRNLKVLMSKSG